MADSQPAPESPTPPAPPAAPTSPPSPPGRRRPWPIALIAVVVGLIVGGALGWGAGRIGASNAASGTSTPAPGNGNTCDAITVSNDVLPAVVTVSAIGQSGGGTGTGEIIRSDGYIVTNNHVISAAVDGGTLSVLLSSGVQAPADLVGRDPRSDLAVLKIDKTSLPTVPWGHSSAVVVGQPVVALGAPLGLSGTVTSGIVSALGRTVPVPGDNGQNAILANAIQTDASINPGNSGGALVDCKGALIGINSAIATVPNSAGQTGGGSVGIGFAIPADFAQAIVDQIIATGKVTYPYFGISVAPLPPAAAQELKVPGGLYVFSVVEGGPAAQAGLKEGDVITEVNGHPATSVDVLTQTVMTTKAGQTVPVTYVRDGQTHTAQVTLQNPAS
ncbi:S1C family serine protease [Diaminobutyricibacter sp. McL0618]|uniref:S1C family serine protease n=1 Tax=Leifsonia sp. McL0618 TaxID=3415677 RepID=UPI003CF502DF